MRTPRMALLLLPTLLAGCWPYIGDDWVDAVDRDAGAMGVMSYVKYQGTYWDGETADTLSMSWGLIEPFDFRFYDLYSTDWDKCETDYDGGRGYTFDEIGADTSVLGVGGDSFEVPYSEQGVFAGDLPLAAWQPGEEYTMTVTDSDVDDFVIYDVVRVPGEFALATPDLDGELGTVGPADLSFRWTGDDGEAFVLELILVDGQSGSTIQSVSCLAENDGEFKVPASAFTKWEADAVLYMVVSLMSHGEGIVQHNDGRSAVAGIFSLYGAALTE
jgi:hypothetical protein